MADDEPQQEVAESVEQNPETTSPAEGSKDLEAAGTGLFGHHHGYGRLGYGHGYGHGLGYGGMDQ